MFSANASQVSNNTDPQFNYVTMLLHGDGTNGAQNNTFLDSSSNNFTITRNGNTTQGTLSPYGANWSNYFDGSGTYLYFPNTSALSFGTGDFCVEAWVFKMNSPNASIIDARATNTATPWGLFVDGSGYPYFYNGTQYTSTIALSLNTWTHIAVTRSSGTLKIFVNGVQGFSGSVTANMDRSGGYQVIGAHVTGASEYLQGYISNLRVVKGAAVYTSAFTPSTTPLTAISGTSLLICQSNRFADASSNAFAISTSGSPSVQRFSPFAPTSAYSPSVIGGSGYFDGSGDYLNLPNNSLLSPEGGDFCIEAWIYPMALPSQYAHIYCSNSTNGVTTYINSSGTVSIGYSGNFEIAASATAIPLNAWTHVAFTRSGTTVRVFLNGVQSSSATNSTNFSSSVVGTIGYVSPFNYFNGYFSGMRFVKGSAVYTSGFTPPPAPPTAITNTQLLCNFINAGIFDNAEMNDLETVGTAQISTSVVKYGTGSMYFDGSGNLAFNGSNTAVLGTGDFTIEFWAYLPNAAASGNFLDMRPNSTNGAYPNIYYSGGVLGYYVGGADRITGGSLSSTTWFHVAVCRSSGTTKMFLNGTQVGSSYADSNNYTCGTTRPMIGGNGYLGSSNFTGYIDDYRITKGYARYTANFTPPTAAFPNN